MYLDRNQISHISKDAFDQLNNLTFLNLAYNQLKVLDFRWSKNLKSLSSLHLADDRIKKIKLWMDPWPTLKQLSLNNNAIPVILPRPNNAEMFNFEENPIYCGCRPDKVNLFDISTFCKVRMQFYYIER